MSGDTIELRETLKLVIEILGRLGYQASPVMVMWPMLTTLGKVKSPSRKRQSAAKLPTWGDRVAKEEEGSTTK